MKDKIKDIGKMIQDQKPSGNDVKCAEIKALPKVASNGFVEKQKFKIGEYNRATASFEMKSSEDVRSNSEAKPKFDLSAETGPCQYFKSLFARSMVVNSSSDKCKSLDHAFTRRNGCKEGLPKKVSPNGENIDNKRNASRERFWMMPGKENWDLRRGGHLADMRDDDDSGGGSSGGEGIQSNKKSEMVEMEQSSPQSLMGDRPGSRSSSLTYNRFLSAGCSEKRLEEARIRSPMTSSCRSSFHRSYSSTSDVDSVMLQSQVTTLEWQLRQAEASRQMYRAVMEQVVSFLQKTHKNLDILQNRLDDNDVNDVTRIPRSRSVHAVHGDTSPVRFSSPRSETNLSFQKAKSFAQIGDPDCPKHGTMYREMSWRRPRKQQRDVNEVNPSKLSEEAFRLLRTVKSLLNTREPDLTSRLNPASTTCSSPANIADVSSASSTVSATLESDISDRFQSRESLLGTRVKDSEVRRRRESTEDATATINGGVVATAKSSPPQLSISSADDESGFSSLNSFQEIGAPMSNSTLIKMRQENNYPEVGLPKIDDTRCKVHRRWSSTPVDNHLTKLRPASLCTNGEAIRVLWV